MSVSFKSAAREFRKDSNWKKGQIAAVICDMAHAISRGRNPSAPTSNARVWWRDHAFDYDCGVTDYMGESCDIFTYLYELGNDLCEEPVYLQLREAISLCRKNFRRVGWPKIGLTDKERGLHLRDRAIHRILWSFDYDDWGDDYRYDDLGYYVQDVLDQDDDVEDDGPLFDDIDQDLYSEGLESDHKVQSLMLRLKKKS